MRERWFAGKSQDIEEKSLSKIATPRGLDVHFIAIKHFGNEGRKTKKQFLFTIRAIP
jgi:hypothetical protein